MSVKFSSRDLSLIRRASSAVLSRQRFSDQARWHTAVMKAFARLTGAHKVGLGLSRNGKYELIPLHFESSAVKEYNEYYNRFDFGRALGGQGSKGTHVLSSLHHFAGRTRELHESEYFCDYIRRYRVFDTVALSSRRSHHERGAVIYLWHEKEMSDTQRARAMAIMDLLMPAFRSGMTVSSNIVAPGSLVATIDIMSDGCALFSGAGVLLHRNPAMSAMLSRSSDAAPLQAWVFEAAEAVRSLFFEKKQATATAQPYSTHQWIGPREYRISGIVLGESSSCENASILVTVNESRRSESIVATDVFQSRFGLTARENEVALMLAARKTNLEIATILGVSAHTARHHTERVLKKLRVDDRRDVASAFEKSGTRSA